MLNVYGLDRLKKVLQHSVFKGWLVLFVVLLGQSASMAQTTYYVANTGSDSNNGTGNGTPFESVGKINSLDLRPGDQVLFRRGDTFRGTLSIRKSGSASAPITYDAYGNGADPVLAGSTIITNWTNLGNNVWQGSCSACGDAVTGVYRSGKALPLGRYPNADGPNKGNLTIRAHTEKYQIFSLESLPANIDWKGAEVVMRPAPWILDRAVVDAQYGDALNLFNYSNYTPKDNSEYFFQNHPATLDKNGEWCYDKANRKILVYSDQGIAAGAIYTATTYGRSVDMINSSYVIVRNLQLAESLNTAFFGQNISNFALTNSTITNSGEDAIIISGNGSNVSLENNKINDANNNGINIDPYKSVKIRGNSIRRIGIIAGRGKSGDGQYNGVASSADENVLIENNVIDSVGYNGITFWNNTTIRQNVIANYCFIKIDGGGVYAHNGNKQPMYNIQILSNIFYTKPAGSVPWVDYAIGIFLDDCVTNVAIKDNTVFGNTQWGVFLHAANNVTFTNNTLFDNSTCQLVVYHNNGECPVRGDIIKNNVIVSKTAGQLVAQYESNANDLLQYGTIDSNYYARPFNETSAIRGVINSGTGGNFTLQEWQNFSGGQDIHSKASPIRFNQYKNEGSGGGNRIYDIFEGNNNGWQLVYSPYNNAEAAYDNTNKLDGGSLRISFPTPSGKPNSYAQAAKPFGAIIKGRTYVLRFDAISSVNVPVLIYLRQYGAPYREFDRRYAITLEPTRKSYEMIFTASDTEANTIVMFQTDTEGPVIWLDNVRLQEGVAIQNEPDDFIKLYYNPTLKDSTVALPTGAFRDVKNLAYAGSVLLKPFTSVVLLRDTLSVPPADLSLSLFSDKRVLQVNEPTVVRLRIRNDGDTKAELSRWTYRLPANSQFLAGNGLDLNDNVLTGTVFQLQPRADTTFSIPVKASAPGLFRMSAQITTATSRDPDSTPNSGTADGEDDASTTELRVGDSVPNAYDSPNPNQRALPAVAGSQPAPDPAKADLSLKLVPSKRLVLVGEVFSFSLTVSNAGGLGAGGVRVQHILPDGLDVVDSPGWTVMGKTLLSDAASIPTGNSLVLSFQVRATSLGMWTNQAQINESSVADPDSTPGNGFANGEDDQAQVDIRVR